MPHVELTTCKSYRTSTLLVRVWWRRRSIRTAVLSTSTGTGTRLPPSSRRARRGRPATFHRVTVRSDSSYCKVCRRRSKLNSNIPHQYPLAAVWKGCIPGQYCPGRTRSMTRPCVVVRPVRKCSDQGVRPCDQSSAVQPFSRVTITWQ